MSDGVTSQGSTPAEEAPIRLFVIAPTKMLVLYVASFGLYPVFWTYQQWKRLGADWCFPRALFHRLTNFDLFKRISRQFAGARTRAFDPTTLATVVILCGFALLLPDSWWLISVLEIVPILIIQSRINALHRERSPDGTVRFEKHDRGVAIALLAVSVSIGLLLGAVAVVAYLLFTGQAPAPAQ